MKARRGTRILSFLNHMDGGSSPCVLLGLLGFCSIRVYCQDHGRSARQRHLQTVIVRSLYDGRYSEFFVRMECTCMPREKKRDVGISLPSDTRDRDIDRTSSSLCDDAVPICAEVRNLCWGRLKAGVASGAALQCSTKSTRCDDEFGLDLKVFLDTSYAQ